MARGYPHLRITPNAFNPAVGTLLGQQKLRSSGKGYWVGFHLPMDRECSEGMASGLRLRRDSAVSGLLQLEAIIVERIKNESWRHLFCDTHERSFMEKLDG